MPLEDGYSLARKLRRRSPSARGDIKAIAITAYADEVTRSQGLRSGFCLLLTKPIEPLELGHVLKLFGTIGNLVLLHLVIADDSSTSKL